MRLVVVQVEGRVVHLSPRRDVQVSQLRELQHRPRTTTRRTPHRQPRRGVERVIRILRQHHRVPRERLRRRDDDRRVDRHISNPCLIRQPGHPRLVQNHPQRPRTRAVRLELVGHVRRDRRPLILRRGHPTLVPRLDLTRVEHHRRRDRQHRLTGEQLRVIEVDRPVVLQPRLEPIQVRQRELQPQRHVVRLGLQRRDVTRSQDDRLLDPPRRDLVDQVAARQDLHVGMRHRAAVHQRCSQIRGSRARQPDRHALTARTLHPHHPIGRAAEVRAREVGRVRPLPTSRLRRPGRLRTQPLRVRTFQRLARPSDRRVDLLEPVPRTLVEQRLTSDLDLPRPVRHRERPRTRRPLARQLPHPLRLHGRRHARRPRPRTRRVLPRRQPLSGRRRIPLRFVTTTEQIREPVPRLLRLRRRGGSLGRRLVLCRHHDPGRIRRLHRGHHVRTDQSGSSHRHRSRPHPRAHAGPLRVPEQGSPREPSLDHRTRRPTRTHQTGLPTSTDTEQALMRTTPRSEERSAPSQATAMATTTRRLTGNRLTAPRGQTSKTFPSRLFSG